MIRSERTQSYWLLFIFVLITVLLAGGARPFASASAAEAATVITVFSGQDPDAREDLTCQNASPCTLRRAIVQANQLGAGARPVTIRFDIPPDEEEGYDEEVDAWRIELRAGAGTAALPVLLGGQITIDGMSQPGEREFGPQIILLGPGSGGTDGLVIGQDESGGDDGNRIIGLAFQNFRDHLIINSNDNQVIENWFGLNDEGLAPYLRGGQMANGSGETGLKVESGTGGNIAEANVFLGFNAAAIALLGDESAVVENLIGTDAEGEVPVGDLNAANACAKGDWLGGSGIRVEGAENEVTDNTLAGLRQENVIGVQPDALHVRGELHIISDNFIGLDFNGETTGVCGRGIMLAESPREVLVADNTVANSVLSGISMNGEAYSGNTLRGNRIQRDIPWQEGETAVQLGFPLPLSLVNFAPAQISEIKGGVVRGTSGVNSPCANCWVEVFLDDNDNVAEALASLAIVQADYQGNWEAPLNHGPLFFQGLRTMSTTAANNTIPGLGAGTTTRLSALYLPEFEYSLLPALFGN
jgi:hypothetical protein